MEAKDKLNKMQTAWNDQVRKHYGTYGFVTNLDNLLLGYCEANAIDPASLGSIGATVRWHKDGLQVAVRVVDLNEDHEFTVYCEVAKNGSLRI